MFLNDAIFLGEFDDIITHLQATEMPSHLESLIGDYYNMSRVFFVVTALYTGGQPARKLTRGAMFCGRVLTRAFAGSLLSRNAFANALIVFNFLKRELPHLPLHGHIFPFIGTSSPSWARLLLHGHIFLVRTRGGGVGETWFASARAFARLSPGYARDPE